jgi:dipeptidyl aminopeptidase/acylaminoacyl peptidase
MAGNIVMRSFAVRPQISAVVIWAGAVYTYIDQREYGINDNSYRPPQTSTVLRSRRQELFNKVGSPSAESKFWQEMAPTTYLNDLKGAIQIHHAVDDATVDIRYSRNLNSLLDKTSVPHQLFEYPSGGHNLTGSSFTLAMQRTVEFFDTYLKK